MSQLLYRLGRFAARYPWRVIGVWFVTAAVVVLASSAFGRELDDSFTVPGVDSDVALQLLSAAESEQAGVTAQVVVAPVDAGATFDSAEHAAALASIRTSAGELPEVIGVSDPAISADGRVALIVVQYPLQEALDAGDLELLEAFVEDNAGDPVVQVEAGGDLFAIFDEPENGVGELLGIVAAMVILLLAFGSLIAMGLPIGMAIFGLALGVSSMALVTLVYEIPSFAPQIGAMIGLGVGIDYALFLVTRHREFLGAGMTVEESAGRAVATAGQAVVFAGGTVMIAILGLAFAGIPMLTGAGIAISVLVLIMVLASISLLPAFLGLAGTWIDRLGVHRRTGRTGRGAGRSMVSPGWQRWGTHVANHAWQYAIGVSVLLLTLTAPVLDLQLGFPDDGTRAESTTPRRAYDLVADGFGPGVNGPLLIAVDLSDTAVPDISDTDVSHTGVDLEMLATAIAADEGIAATEAPFVSADAGVATIIAYPTTAPQDRATAETIERLRSEVFPVALADSAATAHVGGASATFADVAERVSDRLFVFIAGVVILSLLLLTMVFRSPVVALKAALLNLLSIGAAYGVMVAVFQWGWGLSLLGLQDTVPIVSFVPMFMFAIVFGLSMDYEVFLLSRVREQYLATGDNDASVIHGIASTARVITSAALIMILVFAGFVLSDDPITKMFGLGLATAIFVDATIVRIVLVPATMKLMGDANWWLPAWLDRLLPTIDIEGETALPAPDYDTPQPLPAHAVAPSTIAVSDESVVAR